MTDAPVPDDGMEIAYDGMEIVYDDQLPDGVCYALPPDAPERVPLMLAEMGITGHPTAEQLLAALIRAYCVQPERVAVWRPQEDA